jgi:hypothetical protein
LSTWLAGINSGDRGQMATAWRGAKDVEVRVALDLAAAERTGGFELHHIEESTASSVLAVVRAKRTRRWLCLRLDVDSNPPNAIQWIALAPTDAPPPGTGSASAVPFDDEARAQVVRALVRELNRSYVFPEMAATLAREIDASYSRHAYDGAPNRLAFARIVTDDMQRVAHDKHLHLDADCTRASHESLHDAGQAPTPAPPPHRPVFGPTRRLEGNVAYVDIATFNVLPGQAREEIRNVMTLTADASAIIFDVRHNGGGEPETVALVCSYLFGSERVHLTSLYLRIPDRTDDYFTDPHVEGPKFGATKPVFVLTSAFTFSAAEEFAYDLQTRKRAVIVGDTTAGGAHPGDDISLPHGFTVFVPNGRAISPITHTDWEGTGVTPDVAVPASKALETAHELALAKVGVAGAGPADGGVAKMK